MNEELLNNSDIKSINTNDIIKNNLFLNESEIIANQIIEKIISLVFSSLLNRKVERKINDFCYFEIKQVLDEIKNLEFLEHDKDDFFIRHIMLEKLSKTPKKEKNKLIDNLVLNEEGQKINKSQIIQDYKFINDLDPNISVNYFEHIDPFLFEENQVNNNIKKEKVVMDILTRKSLNKEKIELQNILEDKKLSKINNSRNTNGSFKVSIPNEKVIEKNEYSKINFSTIKNTKDINTKITLVSDIEQINNWNIISQPLPPHIDRDAGTKIKYDNKLGIKNNLKENISSNENSPRNINSSGVKKLSKNNLLKFKYFFTRLDKQNTHHKTRRIIQNELPTYDLEPEPDKIEETEEIIKMRKKLELEIEEKKMEKIREEKRKKEIEEKEKEFNEKIKKLGNQNITVDVKGELVHIKPLKIESLIDDFKNMRSNSKEVLKIEDVTYQKKSFNNVEVEINKNPIYNFNEPEKLEKKRKESVITSKILQNIKKKKFDEMKKANIREGMKFASGSNFQIMNLECGVNLIEKNQKKSGGRDYFQKYGRCSYEIFQNQLNKTSSGFYFNRTNNNFINININDDNEMNTNNNLNQKNRGFPPLTPVKQLKKERTEYELMNTSPNRANYYLQLKTKDLNHALSNLDLIDEKKINEKNFENNNNFFKKSNKGLNIEKRQFGDMNIFNKTLMENKFWGEASGSHKNIAVGLRLPSKPEKKYLKREINENIINHLPRKRLPPISSAVKLFTENSEKYNLFNNKKKLKDLKYQNLSKDSLVENKKKYYLNTTSGFYTNKEGGFIPSRKKEEIK